MPTRWKPFRSMATPKPQSLTVTTMISRDRVSSETQSAILEFAESQGVELSEALQHFGYEYNDLIYDNSETRRWEGRRPLTLADYLRKPNGVPLVSFFTGCGGLDIGFEAAGFRHTAAFEINELFCKTMRRNRPEWTVFGPPNTSGDVSDFESTVNDLHTLIRENFEGVFIGGPPCQPFSIAANQRFSKAGDNFKRNRLCQRAKREFVIGLHSVDRALSTCLLCSRKRTWSPRLGRRQANVGGDPATDEMRLYRRRTSNTQCRGFGVPQVRERLFLTGTRTSRKFTYPEGASDFVGSGAVLCRDQGQAPNNETRVHKLSSVRRYAKLDYGQRDSLGRVDRLDPSLPAKVVIAGGTKGGGRSHLHPEIPRTLSVRESARLQTFPDDYILSGSTSRQFTQVGNAVPPVLAAQIAIAIADSYYL